jgi:hypothetical protein
MRDKALHQTFFLLNLSFNLNLSTFQLRSTFSKPHAIGCWQECSPAAKGLLPIYAYNTGAMVRMVSTVI